MVEQGLLTYVGEKQHRNCHFYRPAPAPADLLKGRGLAPPIFYNAKR